MMRKTLFVLLLLLAFVATANERGWLGLSFSHHSDASGTWLKLCGVTPNGPAARAGLQQNDLLTHVDGKRIAFASGAVAAAHFAKTRPGDRVRVRVARGTRNFEITLVAVRRQ
jgi:S1-C subfamily serine protease